MRTTLMVWLIGFSVVLTAASLLIIRISLQQQIQGALLSDLNHSLGTFRNIAHQRNQMLAREAALLADLPSLKALMATQDAETIRDGSHEFWTISGADFFALTGQSGNLFTYSSNTSLNGALVANALQSCMNNLDEPCRIAVEKSLYELSVRPIYFGPPSNGSQLGYVIIGYAIDPQVAREVSEAAEADVAFVVNGEVAAATLLQGRLNEFRSQSQTLGSSTTPREIWLGKEAYMMIASPLPAQGEARVQLVVLTSYDRASEYLRSVNRWLLGLGLSALLIGLLLAAAISRTVTRPLEALAAGARALGQGNFDYSLTSGGAVEVRDLALTFEIMRDELRRTQGELIEAERLATIGRMASSVSHDLRHHLSAIYANAEFMSLARTSSEERSDLLAEVQEGVQGMTDLIESLLLFSQAGQALHLTYEPIIVLVERTIHTVRQHPQGRDVEIRTALTSVDAWVDSRKLGRAIYNLVLNACQAARSGGAPALVIITLVEDNESFEICIADNGAGVPASIRDTLFQPFISSGKENGVGLGLTLAHHIAQEHGGEVRLEATAPGKTIFSIVLRKQAPPAIQEETGRNVEIKKPSIELEAAATRFGHEQA
ncbi:MAG TPA: ATP-binding protein [Acidisarcina sp.]